MKSPALKVRKKLAQYRETMFASRSRFIVFLAFLTLLFFSGGGSRADIQSLLLLRPIAILVGMYAIFCLTREDLKGRLFPLWFLGSLAVLMVVQLIPLPPAFWSQLPGREIIEDIAALSQLEPGWRPLSLSPAGTLNSLFSLTVPLAMVLLYLSLDSQYHKNTITIVIALCIISALWAVLQLVGASRGPLYLYRITNFGSGVGLFANRNHQAAVLALGITMLGWYAATLKPKARFHGFKFFGSVATIFVFIPLIIVTGSRAGLVLMVPALIFALMFFYFDFRKQAATGQRKPVLLINKISLPSHDKLLLITGFVGIAAMAILTIILSRSVAYDRLFAGNEIDELRIRLLPVLSGILLEYFPWGSGFGSFEHVYRIFEPQEFLNSTYLNHAHNDWMQFLIEGGLPVLVIGLCGAIWLGKQFWFLVRVSRAGRTARSAGFLCLALMFILLAASLVDYPLRVPSLVAIFALAACLLGDMTRAARHYAG
ncbi:MAG: O-antigen ligase family protein [Pseudomonadota bacterium]